MLFSFLGLGWLSRLSHVYACPAVCLFLLVGGNMVLLGVAKLYVPVVPVV